MFVRPLLVAATLALVVGMVPSCSCEPPPSGKEGEGEGSVDPGEGEGEGRDPGEGEGEGDTPRPPTDPIREPNVADPQNATLDSDCDGLSDAEEFSGTFAGGARTDPADYDSDDDGLADGVEAGRTQAIDAACPLTWIDEDPTSTSSPVQADSDGDCRPDGVEDTNLNGRFDPGEGDPTDPDSDGDGIDDRVEDLNCNGLVDSGESDAGNNDTDGDGVHDGNEVQLGLDPLDSDSDNDGLVDGVDPNPLQADPDNDRDGLPTSIDVNDNDPDRDDDGLCDGPGNVQGVCVSGEDLNVNGSVDPNETDPARADTDADTLTDKVERDRGTNPRLPDSDGDLLTDAKEGAYGTNPLVRDTDADGIPDGLEDRNLNGLRETNETDAKNPDTDGDDLCDGPATVANVCTNGEDRNKNGVVDAGETDPLVADLDTDGDGISDQQEGQLGTNPNNPDTDADGLNDGGELAAGTNPTNPDTDGDALSDGIEVTSNTDPLSADSDGDGIKDGVEDANHDGIRQPTETDPRVADTDGDGVIDGAEDGNQNGVRDPGELNPLDPTDVQGNPTISAACATPVQPVVGSEPLADILFALSPEFASSTLRPITADGTAIGISAFDATNRILAFAITRTPAPTATAQTQLAAIEAALGADLSLPITQTFTTWDGFEAARGTYNIASGTDSTALRISKIGRAALGRTQTDANVAFDYSGAPTESGAIKLGLVVVRRSANTSIVVGVATNLAQFNTRATGRDFRLEDVGGGTAQAQVGDGIGTQCEVVPSAADVPVDFVLAIDNSGSMGDEIGAVNEAIAQFNRQLANSDLDGRVMAVSTEFQYRISGPTFSGVEGTCGFGPPNTVGGLASPETHTCSCAFTRSNQQAAFTTCIDHIRNDPVLGGLQGSGAEGSFGAIKEFMRDVATPGTAQGVTENATKVRSNARVVAIMITDAGEQTPLADNPAATRMPYDPDNVLQNGIAKWRGFFGNTDGAGWDPTRTDEPAMFLSGILCPIAANCVGEEDSTGPEAANASLETGQSLAIGRYYGVIQGQNGIIGAIANTAGVGFPVGSPDIGLTIEAILRNVVTNSSPYVLTKSPIASTIKIALEGPTVGLCNNTGASPNAPVPSVPRTSSLDGNGFLYDATTNSIAFVGTCRPLNTGTDVAISYRTWIDNTADPDGDNQPCGGTCLDPRVCVNDQCLCPADCGVPGGLPTGQTCDPATCTPTCLADCGGCSPGEVCNTSSCQCECPANCNFGGPLPSGFVCNLNTCLPECAPNGCPGTPVGNQVCGPSCTFICPSDCGGGLEATQRCNPVTCRAECPADCNAQCSGFESCNTASCACECDTTGVCPAGKVFDVASCSCICDAASLGCDARHVPNLDTCACECGANCNNACTGGAVCQPSDCSCSGIGG